MRFEWRAEESDAQIVIGVLVASFYFHAAASLKEKRGQVLRVKAKLSQRSGSVAVAEVGKQDDPHQAVLAAVTVGCESPTVHRALQEMKEHLERESLGELVHCETELLHY